MTILYTLLFGMLAGLVTLQAAPLATAPARRCKQPGARYHAR
jgi:hypothetical protein